MTHSPEKTPPDRTITPLGREILKYFHILQANTGQRSAAYRKARSELIKIVHGGDITGEFNWGFEAVLNQELHVLEELGLIDIKYGSGAILAGHGGRNQIYQVALTAVGMETVEVILEREAEDRARAKASSPAIEPLHDDDVPAPEKGETTTLALDAAKLNARLKQKRAQAALENANTGDSPTDSGEEPPGLSSKPPGEEE